MPPIDQGGILLFETEHMQFMVGFFARCYIFATILQIYEQELKN